MTFRVPIWAVVGAVVVLIAGGLVLFFRGETQKEASLSQAQRETVVQDQTEEQLFPTVSEEESQEVVEISMVARQFAFEPSVIRVKQGQRVRLKIKSTDVAHGIAIPDFGINEVLEPNKEVVVEFTADKKGSFPFLCSVFCGSGHSQMRGEIVVE